MCCLCDYSSSTLQAHRTQAAAEEIAQRPEEPCSNFAKSFADCMSYNSGEPSQSAAVKSFLHEMINMHEAAGACYSMASQMDSHQQTNDIVIATSKTLPMLP